MAQNTYENCIADQLDKTVKANTKAVNSCIEYLKIVSMYSRLIQKADSVEEAKEWASKMLDHALKVK